MNKVEINDLFDVYGSLLTKRQQEILQLYVQEDFSYTEISEELNISRAAVLDAVHKSIQALQRYEASIEYIKRKEAVLNLVSKDESLFEKIQEIL